MEAPIDDVVFSAAGDLLACSWQGRIDLYRVNEDETKWKLARTIDENQRTKDINELIFVAHSTIMGTIDEEKGLIAEWHINTGIKKRELRVGSGHQSDTIWDMTLAVKQRVLIVATLVRVVAYDSASFKELYSIPIAMAKLSLHPSGDHVIASECSNIYARGRSKIFEWQTASGDGLISVSVKRSFRMAFASQRGAIITVGIKGRIGVVRMDGSIADLGQMGEVTDVTYPFMLVKSGTKLHVYNLRRCFATGQQEPQKP